MQPLWCFTVHMQRVCAQTLGVQEGVGVWSQNFGKALTACVTSFLSFNANDDSFSETREKPAHKNVL